MSSQWMDKFSIMRDLSMAQGCVPADVDGTVFNGDRPPLQNVTEETAPEYFLNYMGGDGDFAAPDLALIRHMLHVMRQQDDISPINVEEETCDKVEITKVKPSTTTVVKPEEESVVKPKVEPKVKKGRNVAMESLLQLQVQRDMEQKSMKLLKPQDFSDNITESVKKVNGWLDTQEKPIENEKITSKLDPSSMFNLDPSLMFKKKIGAPVTPLKPVKECAKATPQVSQYVPSTQAEEYYKKFLESSKMKAMLKEDVWSKAEKQMLEIDERRKLEAELFSMSLELSKTQSPTSDITDKRLDVVRLPQHRHLLKGDCVVCSVMKRNSKSDCDKLNSSDNVDSWRSLPVLDTDEEVI